MTMRNWIRSAFLTAGVLFAVGLLADEAQAQTAAPAAGTAPAITAVCKDSTTFSGTSKRGACSGHGGVESWGTTAAAAPVTPTSTAAATTISATCKDETTFSGSSKRGACSGHGGVKSWDAAAAARATVASTTSSPAPMASSATSTAKPAPTAARPGGGAGQVWVNTSSKVYHCEGSRWYGKTKQGEYMTEQAAKSEGFRPAQSKTCS
jgi:hypothetical protein